MRGSRNAHWKGVGIIFITNKMNDQNNKLIKYGCFGCLLIFLGFIFSCCSSSSLKSGSDSIFSKKESSVETNSLADALAANDFEKARKLLPKIRKELDTWEYNKAEEQVFNAEINFLAVQGTDEANKRLLVLLNEEPMTGIARSEGQEIAKGKSDFYTEIDNLGYTDEQYDKYIKWCSKYNSRCMQILEIAVNLDNKALAKMMVKAIKNDPEITSRPNQAVKTNYDIFAHYTSKTKDEAKAKYEEQFGKLENTDE